MARLMAYSAGSAFRRRQGWIEMLAEVRRRLCGALGWGLLLAALLLAAALLSYSPQDPSLDTAVGGRPQNLLGIDGAVLADLLRQGFGVAAFAIPIVLFCWSL